MAKAIGTVKIVSYDWLEDSLLSRSKRPKPEEPYLWKKLLREDQPEPPKHIRKFALVCMLSTWEDC